jgi:hypothetical protein
MIFADTNRDDIDSEIVPASIASDHVVNEPESIDRQLRL